MLTNFLSHMKDQTNVLPVQPTVNLEPTPIPEDEPLKTWATTIPPSLRSANWLVVDTETTGLTPFSVPVPTKKYTQKGTNTTLRLRVLTCTWNTGTAIQTFAWDFDIISDSMKKDLLSIVLNCPTVIGHNFGFDLYWLRSAYGPNAPIPA